MDEQPTGLMMDELIAMLDQTRVWVTLDFAGEPRLYTLCLREAIGSTRDGEAVRRLAAPVVVSGDQLAALRARVRNL